MTVLFHLYAFAGRLFQPAVPYYLSRRLARGKEEKARLSERYGRTKTARPSGRLIWVHAASIGEMNAVGPLMSRMTDAGLQVLLTTGTVTSAQLAADRAQRGVIHQYAPLDVRPYVDRFLNYWKPDAAILVESEIWPMIYRRLSERKIPLALVNGRMSKASARNWSLVSGTFNQLMSGVTACLAQTSEDAERFRKLGIRQIEVSGNLKFDRAPLPVRQTDLDELRGEIGSRPMWLAASSHEGEEAAAWAVHGRLAESLEKPLLIIVPRHPGRGARIEQELTALGISAARRSLGKTPKPDVDVYIADTVGELGLFYSVSPVAFIGGSLFGRGGQNPIEAIQLDCAVLHGPHVDNFAGLYEALDRANGGVVVNDERELHQEVARLLGDEKARHKQSAAASAVVEKSGGALERTWAVISPLLGIPEGAATGEAVT